MRYILLPLLLAGAPLAGAANTPITPPVAAHAPAPVVVPSAPIAPIAPVAPAPWPDSRYSQMVEQSPFALATAPEGLKDEHSFADGWKLKGIAKLRDDNGAEEYFVTIKSSDLKDVYSFVGSKENKEGVSVVTVNYSDAVGKSTVLLKKGAETAKVEYDGADILGSPPAPAQAVPRLGGPGVPGANRIVTPGGGSKLLAPANGTRQIGTPGGIPRPNPAVRPPTGPQPPAARRIRTPPPAQ